MGLFSSSNPTPTPEPAHKIAPNRTQRAACWTARDSFFQCLDAHGIIDPIKDSAAARRTCGIREAAFEKECVGSWVEYFKKRRVMEHNRDQMLKGLRAEGARKVDMPNPVGQAQTDGK